jgi:hypothetical protein
MIEMQHLLGTMQSTQDIPRALPPTRMLTVHVERHDPAAGVQHRRPRPQRRCHMGEGQATPSAP